MTADSFDIHYLLLCPRSVIRLSLCEKPPVRQKFSRSSGPYDLPSMVVSWGYISPNPSVCRVNPLELGAAIGGHSDGMITRVTKVLDYDLIVPIAIVPGRVSELDQRT